MNYALRRCYWEGATRLMLADDVGLGKTVMTGLLVREFMLRGHDEGVLFFVPASLSGEENYIKKFDIQCCEYGKERKIETSH